MDEEEEGAQCYRVRCFDVGGVAGALSRKMRCRSRRAAARPLPFLAKMPKAVEIQKAERGGKRQRADHQFLAFLLFWC